MTIKSDALFEFSQVAQVMQLFRERLSQKVHATITKGIVGGFEFAVLQKKFERMTQEAVDVCLRVLKESNKTNFYSYSVRNSVLIISHVNNTDMSTLHGCLPHKSVFVTGVLTL